MLGAGAFAVTDADVVRSTVNLTSPVKGRGPFDRDGSDMRIGELARVTGVSGPAIHNYEERGLLVSHRNAAGQREYTDEAIARIDMIKSLATVGMGITKICELLPSIAGEVATPAPSLLRSLRTERADIDAWIADLVKVRDMLDGALDSLTANKPPTP